MAPVIYDPDAYENGMASPSLRKTFIAFHVTLGLVILVQSISTTIRASAEANHALISLAGLEALAAIMFLIPKTVRPGGILLLVTFAIAFIFHLVHGEPHLGLLVYAMGTLFVIIHGPLSIQDTT